MKLLACRQLRFNSPEWQVIFVLVCNILNIAAVQVPLAGTDRKSQTRILHSSNFCLKRKRHRASVSICTSPITVSAAAPSPVPKLQPCYESEPLALALSWKFRDHRRWLQVIYLLAVWSVEDPRQTFSNSRWATEGHLIVVNRLKDYLGNSKFQLFPLIFYSTSTD